MFQYSGKRFGGALWIDASAGKQCGKVKESDVRRDGYPEDMNSGSLYLASMGVRKEEGDVLGRERMCLVIDGRVGG